MKIINVDKEFKNLIPPLKDWEYKQLEASILLEGCRDPLVVWNNILLDGHNRYEICIKHKIEFETISIDLKDRNEAKIWIYRNQIARRNLNMYQRARMALLLEPIFREKAREHLVEGGAISKNPMGSQISANPIDVRAELAQISNVSHDTIGKVMKIDKLATEKEKEKLDRGTVSINEIHRRICRREKRGKPQKLPPIPEGKFNIVYADPPWEYKFSKDSGRSVPYPDMELKSICNLKINKISIKEKISEDAILFLWVTPPKIEEAIEVIKTWEFDYKTCSVWIKDKIGMGYYFRNRHELLLVATKGEFPAPPENTRVDSVINSPRTEHSEKPKIVYEIIEKMYPNGKYLELFARNKRPNWTGWGLEYGRN